MQSAEGDAYRTQVVTAQVTSLAQSGPGPHTLYGHRDWSTSLFSFTDDTAVCEYQHWQHDDHSDDAIIMAALRSRCGHYILQMWYLLLSFFLLLLFFLA